MTTDALHEATTELSARLSRELFVWEKGRPRLASSAVFVDDLACSYGTPLYLYDSSILERQWSRLRSALPESVEIFYSIKANPHPSVVRFFVGLGTGCEIASGGEYAIARRAGVPADRIVFAGPGKGREELEFVIAQGIGEIHIESCEEIELIDEIARRREAAVNVSIRINPRSASGGGLMMGGQATVFGFEEESLPSVVQAVSKCSGLALRGIHFYTGTQILDASHLLEHWRHAVEIAKQTADLAGQSIATIDLGGGLGVPYFAHEKELDLDTLRTGASNLISAARADERLSRARFIVEPGRFLTAAAGIYVARVRSVKTCRGVTFVVIDGGMNQHLAASGNLGQVIRRDYPIVNLSRTGTESEIAVTVVGPLCTPIDTMARKVNLARPQVGDLIGILQSGAYGLTASPVNFLTHPLPAEVLIKNGFAELITPKGIAFE